MPIRMGRLAFFLSLAASAAPAGAAGWSVSGGAAPVLAYDGGTAGPSFRCAGGGLLQIAVPGGGGRYESGRAYTVTLAVDGVATLLTMRAQAAEGGDVFVLTRPLAESDALLQALARGKELEVASPAGNYRLALTGTSKGVTALRQACR